MHWQDWFVVALISFILFTAWRDAHPPSPAPPDYLSSFNYFVSR